MMKASFVYDHDQIRSEMQKAEDFFERWSWIFRDDHVFYQILGENQPWNEKEDGMVWIGTAIFGPLFY